MAAVSAAKENAPTPTSVTTASAAAASRRRGYAVKSCGGGVRKRAGRARLLGRRVRVPLRDITNLVQAAVSGPHEAPLGQEVPPGAATEVAEPHAVVVVRLAAVRGGGDDDAGPAATAARARYFLRKGFR